VYIHEAHPSDAWQMASNVRENVVFATPRSLEEKGELAGTCVRKLGIEIPALVDDTRETVETAYTGWPDRLYVIDREGRIAYKSEPGPFGFHPQGVAATLKRLAPPR
jgi:type I thyroxine 5'-deiodinase